jgi:hypothetical protein
MSKKKNTSDAFTGLEAGLFLSHLLLLLLFFPMLFWGRVFHYSENTGNYT